MKEEVLRMEHICVKQRGNYALHDLKLNIYKGEIVIAFGFSGQGLYELGEFLSGKHAESGRLLINEKEINISKDFSPEQNGMFVIHNKNNIIPDLTIAENLFLGEKRNVFAITVSVRKQEKLAQMVVKKFGLNLNVKKKVKEYSNYYLQMMIKMMKAYVKGAKIVVINEILEIANPAVREKFFDIIRILQEDGISVLWLSQRIDTIQNLADRIVVVRNGQCVKNFYKGNYNQERLMQAAAESQISSAVFQKNQKFGKELFTLKNLMGSINICIRKSQIIGISSNQAEKLEYLCTILTGESCTYNGSMELQGKLYAPKNHEESVASGVQYIDFMWPERHYIPDMSVMDNLMLENYWFSKKRYTLINQQQQRFIKLHFQMNHPEWSQKYWRDLMPDQQRVLLYERYLNLPEKILIITEPFTRVNYYLLQEIIEIFYKLRDNGNTLILLSTNYMDLKNVCDQIYTI